LLNISSSIKFVKEKLLSLKSSLSYDVLIVPKYFKDNFIKILSLRDIIVLSSNELSDLPENFVKITFGGNLDLSNNYITLPDNFGDIKVVGNLNLSNNDLKYLPENFGDIKVGGNLNLSNNDLTYLPENFGDIKVGGDLYLSNNDDLINLPKYLNNVSGEFIKASCQNV
jgi:hypothetical protein